MRNGAVVALEEVLARNLPVCVELELGAETELERIDVEDLAESRRHVGQRLGQRGRLGIGIYEHEGPEGVDLDLPEPELVAVHSRLAIGARCVAQPAVARIGPRVVRALQRLARPVPTRDYVPAMAADVEEGPKLSVTRACNHYGYLAGGGREEARLRDLSRMAHVLPGPREDPLTLTPQDFGICVPGPGKRPLHAREL